MSFQDFNVINIGKNTVNQKVEKKVSFIDNEKKKLLVDDPEVFKHKYIKKETINNIISARTAKKMTRKQLANACNIKEQELTEIETGKSLNNNPNINKIIRFLNVKKT